MDNNVDIAILYAGENLSEGLALQIEGKLKTKDIIAKHYKEPNDNIEEDGYKDKVKTFTTKLARCKNVIVILSEKYITNSIFCQEEIRELVGKYKNNYRNHVYVVCSEEEIYTKIRSEPEKHALLDAAKILISEHEHALNATDSCSEQRINEIRFCANTIEEFLSELSEKRSYLYRHTEIDLLITQLLDNVKGNNASNKEDELTLFLSLFNSCFPDDADKKYTKHLSFKNDNDDINKVNELYKACMRPSSINIVENVIKNRTKLVPFSSGGIAFNDYTVMKFLENYYIPPSAVYKRINNGLLDEEYKIEQNQLIEEVYEALNDHRIVFLEGAVGEGKSTFIDKFMYDTYKKNHSSNTKEINFIYKRLDSENEETEDDIYNEILSEAEKYVDSIVIIDNLDSFSFDFERFMFTKQGYVEFKKQIKKTRGIVGRLKTLISKRKIKSILIACRPYVLSHFFNGQRLVDNNPIVETSKIYSLEYKNDISEKIILSKLELFQEMIEILLGDNSVKEGRKRIFQKHSENILSTINLVRYETDNSGNLKKTRTRKLINGELVEIEEFIPKKHPRLEKLLKVSTQGFRTIIRLYYELGYNEKLFKTYFTNRIFLFYTLGLFEKYSQILPHRKVERGTSNTGKILNYPNMFLSVAVSEANKHIACAQPHKITYWLKILLLAYIKKEKLVSVKDVINQFSNYDEGLVKIALGSLGTINEYNCIEYEFPSENNNLYDDFLNITKAKLTTRGSTIISEHMYLDYNNIEFFIDDWQLPKPQINKIYDDKFEDVEFLKILYKLYKQEQFFNYNHLVGNHKEEILSFRQMIQYKSKLIIWLTYFFEAALKKELEYYKIDFFKIDPNLFNEKRQQIINRGEIIIKSHYQTDAEENYTNNLNNFNRKCREYNIHIENFIDEVFNRGVKVICVKCS